MKTKIEPWGVVLTIRHEDKTYHGIIQNDFERFKTFGNFDLSTDTLILFDEEFNKLSFEENKEKTCELYDLFEELIEKIVVNQEEEVEKIPIWVLFKDNRKKSLMTREQFFSSNWTKWYDSFHTVNVPVTDWNDGKVDLNTIDDYLD